MTNQASKVGNAYDVSRVREDFPILQRTIHGRLLVYLDNAATTQKPRAVIEAISRYYCEENSNIHRGVHLLSEQATRSYEAARVRIQRFVNAPHRREIIFVRGATEGINLVAHSWGRRNIREGDEILVSSMEHHSNIVPWQLLCEETGAVLRPIPITDDGQLDLEAYERLLSPRVRLVAVTHVSNAIGTVNPIREVVASAHARDIKVLVDGAQAAPHVPVDVQELDCDFYVFSGHKIYGPTGIGVMYGKTALLEAMPPYQGGGDMIRRVTFEKSLWNELPFKFEAGTPHIEGAIGLAAALDYLSGLGLEAVAAYEQSLLSYATEALGTVPGLRLIGTAPKKTGILSFVLEHVHPHDIGTILDLEGIAIRTGHHCAQPLMDRFGIPATARASLALYNTREEIDALVVGLHRVQEVFN